MLFILTNDNIKILFWSRVDTRKINYNSPVPDYLGLVIDNNCFI